MLYMLRELSCATKFNVCRRLTLDICKQGRHYDRLRDVFKGQSEHWTFFVQYICLGANCNRAVAKSSYRTVHVFVLINGRINYFLNNIMWCFWKRLFNKKRTMKTSQMRKKNNMSNIQYMRCDIFFECLW